MRTRQGISEDYAIVVGVQHYPGLGNGSPDNDLKGPINDARAFYDWLVAAPPNGAGVPERNACLLAQTSSPAGRLLTPAEILGASPNLNDITNAFRRLDGIALQHKAQKDVEREKVGRRLYLYMAGHGIEPGLSIPGISVGPALLLANATDRDFRQHLLGKQYASFYALAGYFDEVLLFMDCCRDYTFSVAARPLDRDNIFGTEAQHLYGFGTKLDRRTREMDIGGQSRGIFTLALLEALRGDASDPVTSQVTAASLRDVVPVVMEEIVAHSPLGSLTQFPEFEFSSPREIVVCTATPKLHQVTIPLPPAAIGKNFSIRYTSRLVVKVIHKEKPMGTILQVSLPRGIYTGQFSDMDNVIQSAAFEVPQKPAVQFQFVAE